MNKNERMESLLCDVDEGKKKLWNRALRILLRSFLCLSVFFSTLCFFSCYPSFVSSPSTAVWLGYVFLAKGFIAHLWGLSAMGQLPSLVHAEIPFFLQFYYCCNNGIIKNLSTTICLISFFFYSKSELFLWSNRQCGVLLQWSALGDDVWLCHRLAFIMGNHQS